MISIQVKGLKELEAALEKFPRYLKAVQSEFSRAASEVVLADQGGGKPFYPPETQANQPPPPYYIRGTGMQYANYNTHKSEQMDRRFVTDTKGWMTRIRNTASYAPYVIGEEQTDVMEYIGWKKLIDVAREGQRAIAERWEDIVRRTLIRAGLRPK
jgi:hypothetical protein